MKVAYLSCGDRLSPVEAQRPGGFERRGRFVGTRWGVVRLQASDVPLAGVV
jgi:hypothetical protein